MTELNRVQQRPSEQGRDVLIQALTILEARVKEIITLVAKLKDEKAILERRVGELQAAIASQSEQIKTVQSGRRKEQEQLLRLQAEREGVRLKIDRLLEEISKIEASAEPRA